VAGARPPRYPALRHENFVLFWSGGIVSRLGTQMRDVALAWQLYELTRSPLALGLPGLFRVTPLLLLALGGGVAADALDRRRVMLVTQSLLALTSAILGFVTLTGRATPALLYALIALSAATTAFDNPARQALVVNLLPEEDLPNGLALQVLGHQVSTVAGPALGGLLLGATSAGVVYVVDAISFLAVIAALFVVRPKRRAEGSTPVPLRLSALRPAFELLQKRPVLLWLALVDFMATFFAGSMQLLPIFADQAFRVGPWGYGLLQSAPAVGAVVASVLISARPPMRRQGLAVLVSVGVYGAAIAAFGLSRSFPLALGLLALSGAADTVSTVVRQVARQMLTPDELRGRMNAVNMIFFMGGPQLGELEAGIVAQMWTTRGSVVSGGLACIVVALVFGAFVPVLRQLGEGPHRGTERTLPD
jgi:MFS family permease